MEAACAEAQLICDGVVFKLLFLATLHDLCFCQPWPVFDQVFIVFLLLITLVIISSVLFLSLIKFIQVYSSVVIEDLSPDSISLLSVIFEVFTITNS